MLVRDILRLHFDLALSYREIGRSLGIHHTTVAQVVQRFTTSGHSWPLPDGLRDHDLAQWIYPGRRGRPRQYTEPDWPTIHQELRRPGVTLQQLWLEYRTEYPEGLGYTPFCARYRRFAATVTVAMRQHYIPGDRCFVDYAGKTLTIEEPGGAVPGYLFVATLGYRHDTFVEVHRDLSAASWIPGHVHALEYFGGVPRLIVPDNPKAGVIQENWYEPRLHPTYQEWADHYGCAILPARVRKPRDKAKVEAAVLLVERWILAVLRHERFTSFGQAQARVAELNAQLNQRPFKKWSGSRQSVFDADDRPALRPLPPTAYEFGEWRQAKVHKDYPIQGDRAFYRVPTRWVGSTVDVRVTATTVECFQDHERIASHPRIWQPGARSTHPDHLPPAHRAWAAGITPEALITRAEAIGPHTRTLVVGILTRGGVPEQIYRRCLGILDCAKTYGPAILEEAANRALTAQTWSYPHVRAYCETLQRPTARSTPRRHAHLRGSAYYHNPEEEHSSC
ncbi:transposase subunit [Sulfobacillus acidophilus TPY]|nr:transposase subunit [Sulfobacillus acidophilus TPY]